MDSVSFTFTPTGNDYAMAIRAVYLRSEPISRMLIPWTGLTLIAFCCLAIIVVAQFTSPGIVHPIYVVLALCPFLGLVSVPLFLLLFVPMVTAYAANRNERIRTEISWAIDEQGITAADPHVQFHLNWSSFRYITETETLYLFIMSASMFSFHMVPRRAFDSPEHEAAFRAIVERHLGPIKGT